YKLWLQYFEPFKTIKELDHKFLDDIVISAGLDPQYFDKFCEKPDNPPNISKQNDYFTMIKNVTTNVATNVVRYLSPQIQRSVSPFPFFFSKKNPSQSNSEPEHRKEKKMEDESNNNNNNNMGKRNNNNNNNNNMGGKR